MPSTPRSAGWVRWRYNSSKLQGRLPHLLPIKADGRGGRKRSRKASLSHQRQLGLARGRVGNLTAGWGGRVIAEQPAQPKTAIFLLQVVAT